MLHAISQETCVKGTFGKCIRTESGLVPDENGNIVVLNKKKYSAYDIFLGITQYSLVITECERNSYYYQFEDQPAGSQPSGSGEKIQEVTSKLLFADIGTCFPLADIQSCKMKKSLMGSVKCFVTMNNGSYFKLMLPKLGGLGGGMPHYTEYWEAIITRLGESSV